jgi:WD40 repeat protein
MTTVTQSAATDSVLISVAGPLRRWLATQSLASETLMRSDMKACNVAGSPDQGHSAAAVERRGRAGDLSDRPGQDRTTFSLLDGGDLVATVTVDRSADSSQYRILATTDCAERSAGQVRGIVAVVDFDAAHQRIAFGTQGDGVSALDLETGADLGPFGSDNAFIWAIDLGGDDQLAALDEDGELLEWDARTGEARDPIQVFDTPGTVVRIDGEGTLVAGANDGRITSVQPDAQRPVGASLQSLPELGYGGENGILDLAITRTGAVTLDQSGRIVTWDLTGQPPLGEAPFGRQLLADVKVEHVSGMADGSVLAAGGSSLWRLDVGSGDVRSRVDDVAASAIAVRGETIAIGTGTGGIRVGSGSVDGMRDVPSTHRGPIVGLAILASGAIAAVDGGGMLTVDTSGGASAGVDLGGHAMSMAASDDHLYIGMEGGAVLIVDPSDPSRTPVRVNAHRRDVTSMAMRQDGRSVATGSDDRSIILWDIGSNGALTMRAKPSL